MTNEKVGVEVIYSLNVEHKFLGFALGKEQNGVFHQIPSENKQEERK